MEGPRVRSAARSSPAVAVPGGHRAHLPGRRGARLRDDHGDARPPPAGAEALLRARRLPLPLAAGGNGKHFFGANGLQIGALKLHRGNVETWI